MSEDCLFCYEHIMDCRCKDLELKTKQAFLNFFISSMKEFCPRKATRISLVDAVFFVNEWVAENFEGETHQN